MQPPDSPDTQIQLSPDRAVWIAVCRECFTIYFGAISWLLRQKVMSVAYSDRIDEVLVKMIHKFRYSPFEGGGYPEIVENRQVLYTLTQTDSAGMWTDWNVELRRH